MAVRDAKFVDIPRIVELMEEAHQQSVYAQVTTFDAQEARQLLARALQRHGHMNNGGSLVLVAERNGIVEGFMIGILDSVYPCLKELVATDLLFIVSGRADGRDAGRMLRRLMQWAERNPKVVEIRLGVVGAIRDWKRTSKLYTRYGFEQYGAIFRRGLKK